MMVHFWLYSGPNNNGGRKKDMAWKVPNEGPSNRCKSNLASHQWQQYQRPTAIVLLGKENNNILSLKPLSDTLSLGFREFWFGTTRGEDINFDRSPHLNLHTVSARNPECVYLFSIDPGILAGSWIVGYGPNIADGLRAHTFLGMPCIRHAYNTITAVTMCTQVTVIAGFKWWH